MRKPNRMKVSPLWLFSLLFLIITAVLMVTFFKYTLEAETPGDGHTYSTYYAMIVPDTGSEFWRAVYDGAVAEAKEHNAYLELLGENLSTNYSKSELMKIAIASSFDGIILVADESEETEALINEAVAQGIAVVTLYSDNSDSDRCSFVGLSNYNLGKEYGNQVIKVMEEKGISIDDVNIAVLVNAHSQDSGQNILVSGIQETIAVEYSGDKREEKVHNEITLVSVDETNDLSIEASIRSLLIGKDKVTPDIIVCLNEIETTMVYQTIVDYNRVGDITILGYYDSDLILKGIERNVIQSTISIDTTQMGEACITALEEVLAFGNANQYFTADVTLIDKSNVAEHLDGEVQP